MLTNRAKIQLSLYAMQTLAIIASGISGLGSAWFLHREFDVTVFEAPNYIGGHTCTVTVDEAGRAVPTDTGFMVFSHATYPGKTNEGQTDWKHSIKLISSRRSGCYPTSSRMLSQGDQSGRANETIWSCSRWLVQKLSPSNANARAANGMRTRSSIFSCAGRGSTRVSQ